MESDFLLIPEACSFLARYVLVSNLLLRGIYTSILHAKVVLLVIVRTFVAAISSITSAFG